MTLIRKKNPFMPVANLFDDFFADELNMTKKIQTLPSVNIKEDSKKYLIELAVPGFEKKDFDIDLDNNLLTISYSKEEIETDDEMEYTKREFSYNNFKRVFTLPDTANIDEISAEYINGVLLVTISKKEEDQVQPKRKINID